MNAILYLYRCRLKNWLRQSLHKPSRLIMLIFFAALLPLSLIGIMTDSGPAPQDSPFFVSGLSFAVVLVFWGLSLLFGFSAIFGGIDKGSYSFTPADGQFVFTSPMRPQNVLFYGMANMVGTTLISMLFMLYQIPNLINAGIRDIRTIALLFLFFVVNQITAACVQQMIYLRVSKHSRLRPYLKRGLYAVLLILGVVIFFYFINGGTPAGLAGILQRRSLLLGVPYFGWYAGLLLNAIFGRVNDMLICLALMLLLCFVSLLISYRTEADFYEEALQLAEKAAETKEAMKNSDKAIYTESKRKHKVRRNGLGKGLGERTFFFLNMKESLRERPYVVSFLMVLNTLIAAGLYVIRLKFDKTPRFLLFVFIWISLYTMYLFAQNTPLLRQLKQPFFYYAPGSSFKKIFYSSLSPLIFRAADLLPAFLVMGLLLKAEPLTLLLSFILLMSIYLLIISEQLAVYRIMGSVDGFFAKFIYLLLFFLLIVPTVAVTVIAANMPGAGGDLLLLIPTAFHILLFLLSLLLGVRHLARGMEN